MTLMQHRGPYQLTHVKNLNCLENVTDWWTCVSTSHGRCGIQNLCGINIKKFIIRMRGNLASGLEGES